MLTNLAINFFGLGPGELVLILVVALIFFGPKNLPKLGRSLGQGIREFKEATTKMTDSVMHADEEEEKRVAERQRIAAQQQAQDAAPRVVTPVEATPRDKVASVGPPSTPSV